MGINYNSLATGIYYSVEVIVNFNNSSKKNLLTYSEASKNINNLKLLIDELYNISILLSDEDISKLIDEHNTYNDIIKELTN